MKKANVCSLIIGAIAALTATTASANIDVGDTLDLQYWFSSIDSVYQDSGAFTFTGDGQTLYTQGGISYATIYGDHVVFTDACGAGCTQSGASWNGPALTDLSDSTAFTGWAITTDTMGTIGYYNDGATISVNWAGLDANGATTVASSVPEASSSLMLMLGLAGVAGAAARRRSAARKA